MSALLCALLLSWFLLGVLRAMGAIAVNQYVQQGLANLAALEAWNGFFQPEFFSRVMLMLLAALIAWALVRMFDRSNGGAHTRAAIVSLVTFWGLATFGELVDRTPIRDVMTGDVVVSPAHAAIAALGAAGFGLSAWGWHLVRDSSVRSLAATATVAAAAFVLLLIAMRIAVPDAAAHATRPNVLVITIDALRADHLSSYGYSRLTSPHMDRFAASAVLFEKSTSQASSTRPSMAAMLTSEYPTEFTGRPFKYVPYWSSTVAEVFRNAGYRTGAVVSNVWLKSALGFDQGFEEYDETSAMSEFYGDTRRVAWKNASAVSDGALAFLNRHKDERFFLWLHYLDPHHPYEPPAPFDRKFASERADHRELVQRLHSLPTDEQTELLTRLGTRELAMPDETFQAIVDQYDGEIAYTDTQVARVLDALPTLGMADDTLVVITADHGEEFRDHDRWGHGATLYQEVIHVPLIVRFPGDAGGRRVNDLVRTIDIAPTALAVAGLAVPSTMRGADLRRPAERTERGAISVCARASQLSIEVDGWKLITASGGDGQPSLFHLTEDPHERSDLAANQSARVGEMVADLMEPLGPTVREKMVEHIAGVDAASRQQLKALGYLE